MELDHALAIATDYEIASYVALGLLVVADIALFFTKASAEKLAKIAASLSLALLLVFDVAHSVYSHRADRLFRAGIEEQRMRTDALSSVEVTLILDTGTEPRPAWHEPAIGITETIELRIDHDREGFQFTATTMDNEQVTPTLQRSKMFFAINPHTGLLGQPLRYLDQIRFIRVSRDLLKTSRNEKPRATRVVLTVNGATLELSPVMFPWSEDPKRDGIVDIADQMRDVDSKLVAVLTRNARNASWKAQ